MELRRKIDTLLEYFLSILLGMMVLNVLWQVASRYLLHNPSIFTDELSRYLLIWVGLLGAAYASGKGMHVSIELLARILDENQKRIQNLAIHLIIVSFALLVLTVGGIRLVYISFQLGQTSSAMQIPLGYIYLALPASGLLVTYYSLSDFFNLLKKA